MTIIQYDLAAAGKGFTGLLKDTSPEHLAVAGHTLAVGKFSQRHF